MYYAWAEINLKIIFKLTGPLVINILSAYYLWTYKLRKFYHENFFLKEKSLNLKIIGYTVLTELPLELDEPNY